MEFALPLFAALIATVSIVLAPKSTSLDAFYKGRIKQHAPQLFTLVMSQVTTWIFARSLMNAAILGFYYGIWGTLAYAAYYLSFLSGGLIIDSLRFTHGFNSVQDFLRARFGSWGSSCYNVVIGLRLVSEVFANLLVIGILFGIAGSQSYTLAIIIFSAVTLVYSMLGGLSASLKTDVFQMLLFLVLLLVLLVLAFSSDSIQFQQLWFKEFEISEPGPILLAVALLQIWSYPMHDPVMMDRGFLADRATTRKSFLHAAWISILCIVAFGSLGVFAGAQALSGQSMNDVLSLLMGDELMLLFNACLVVSAMSTLDSTLSSSAKLVVVDIKGGQASVAKGRLAMAMFMIAGLGLVFLGNKDLFSAVAVSGTASLYLAPVVFFSLWGRQLNIPLWSYLGAFVIAIGGAILYFTESSGYSQLLGADHKYTKLLYISFTVLLTGCLLFFLGSKLSSLRGHDKTQVLTSA